MQKLKVLIISDGKPGHYTQSLGLVRRLAKAFVVQETILQIKPRIKIANLILRKFLTKHSRYTSQIFKLFYTLENETLLSNKVDLIISTGGNTCGVNALLAKKTGCMNLFIGSLRRHNPLLFTGVVSATPMSEVKNNIVLDIAPNLIDPQQLEKAASLFLVNHEIALDQPLWVMLLGGNGSGYHYTHEDFKTLVAGMLILASKYKIRWLITTSRRIGQANEDYLKALLENKDEVAYAVYYIRQPEKIMMGFLGLGEVVFCTEDSTSMVNEAVMTQKMVITLRAKTHQINKGHAAVIAKFVNHKHIHRAEINNFSHLSIEKIHYRPINTEKGYDKIIQMVEQGITHP